MHFDIVAPLDLAERDRAAWDRFQALDANLDNPFLSWRWPVACAGAGGPDARSGRIVVLRRNGEAVGFLPLRLGRGAAMPVGSPLSDYQALVAEPGLMFDPGDLIRALPVDRVDFNHLVAGQAVLQPSVRGTGESQIVRIDAGYDAYASERRAGGHDILKDTAKKRRKLERERGAAVFTAMSGDAAAFDQLIAWKRQQYRATRQTDIFDAGWPLELLRSLHAGPDPDFTGALFTLHVDGVLAAAHFALRGGAVLHAWFIAHEADFARYSPGVILIDHILQWGAGAGVRELDLGPGDYRFKFQLANATRTVGHGFFGAPSPATLVRAAEYRLRNAAEALPLGRVSNWPGKAMRRVDLWRGLR